MKIAVFSDAHGNLEYLKACMADLRSIEGVRLRVFLGDAVGYGADGLECLRLLEREGFKLLKGNHEAMLLGELPIAIERAPVYNLSRDSLLEEYVKGLELDEMLELHIDGKKLVFVHGSPWNHLTGYLYADSPLDDSDEAEFDWVFIGHTHRPYVRRHRNAQFVNVGSCGMPRDIGNQPSYAVYDTKSNACEIRRLVISREYIAKNYNNVHEAVKLCLLREQ